VISYNNRLRTFFNDQGQTAPNLPNFDIPLSCRLSTNYEFEFDGDFTVEIKSFETIINSKGTLTGDLIIYKGMTHTFMAHYTSCLDSNYTEELSSSILNGRRIYAQSELISEAEDVADLQLITCISAPGPISDMAPVDPDLPSWKLISDGCVKDETLELLPRSESGALRFSFESFNFHGNNDPIHIQCRYQV